MSSDAAGRDLIVVSGPSGAGKSTLCRRVAERLGLRLSVSATTRPPRDYEEDGVHYHFVGREEFERRIEEGRFIEWAQVFDRYYGTPVEELERARREGTRLLLDIDVQGCVQIKRKFPAALAILLLAPAEDVYKERLAARGTERAAEVEKRFAKARDEVRAARESGAYDYEVVNDDLDRAVDEVAALAEQAASKSTNAGRTHA
jgi:guanylate kinase